MHIVSVFYVGIGMRFVVLVSRSRLREWGGCLWAIWSCGLPGVLWWKNQGFLELACMELSLVIGLIGPLKFWLGPGCCVIDDCTHAVARGDHGSVSRSQAPW